MVGSIIVSIILILISKAGFNINFKHIVTIIFILFILMILHPRKFLLIRGTQYLLIYLMMMLSFLSLVITVFMGLALSKIISYDYLFNMFSKYISLFNDDENYIDANSLFFIIILVFLPAYYIYNILLIISTSLIERWFGEKKIVKFAAQSFNKELSLAYFTVIIVFMGFLPSFAEGLIANIETSQVFDVLTLAFILLSLLPTAQLLFSQVKK